MNAIYFDMDGTIVNLYGQENWLTKLRSNDPSPYINAEPLKDMEKLNQILFSLKEKGYIVGIISWLSKGSNKEYDKEVRKAKREWLKKYFKPNLLDEIHIVKYGTPKQKVANVKQSILIDDDKGVREKWERSGGIAIDPV